MASPVRIVLPGEHARGSAAAAACARALQVCHDVEAECSRFDAASDLSRVNDAPGEWHRVGRYCFLALEEAWEAYRRTRGRFDPRVLTDLVALGYDRWPPRGGAAQCGTTRGPAQGVSRFRARPQWRPRFAATHRVHVGGSAVDLGGIGKGLAVRWASRALRRPDHLVDAGGDCYCAGTAPDGGAWRVGMEDPAGGDTPLAVLAVSNLACTTSSVRRRHWTADGRPVHHLIDPSTGRPGGTGLLSVTVIGADAAVAEVWSKVLFLQGSAAIDETARALGLAACWVCDDGVLRVNERADAHVVWRR